MMLVEFCENNFLCLISDGDKWSAVTVGWDIGRGDIASEIVIPGALLRTAYNFQIDQTLRIYWQKYKSVSSQKLLPL